MTSTASDLSGERVDYYRPAGDGMGTAGLQYDFETPAAAREQIQREVDVRAHQAIYAVGSHAVMSVGSEELEAGRLTNIYDIAYEPSTVAARIRFAGAPQSVTDFLSKRSKALAAISGGFLYLADQGSGVPRQASLNLASQKNGRAASLPVVDREALLADKDGQLSVQYVRACGEVTINGHAMSWSGSRSQQPADCTIYGNGNVVIEHALNDELGARKQRIRILDESSRFTPRLQPSDGLVDLGLLAASKGHFRIAESNPGGGVDLFAYDTVLRCDVKMLRGDKRDMVQFGSIDNLPLDGFMQGAMSVGPFITEDNFGAHPVNNDPSLGSDPPFIEVPMVRLALYQSSDERMHVRLFDGRPESSNFKGVTPLEAVGNILRDHEVIWGCFLDPGRTAKIVTRSLNRLVSFGNAHYLQWPTRPGGVYSWVPAAGRPIPSAITLHPAVK